jgi:hypothetical protein
VAEGRSAFDQAQIEAQKSAEAAQTARAAEGKPGEAVEVLDSTAYEEYEKQEGYFVERAFEPPAATVPAAPADTVVEEEVLAPTEKETKQ